MSITYLPPRLPGSPSQRYLKAFEIIARRSQQKRIQVGSRVFLLEMSVTISQLNGVSAQVIDFPVAPENTDAITSRSAQAPASMAAQNSTTGAVGAYLAGDQESKRAARQNKRGGLIALLNRDQGATLAELMELSGWRKPTVRAFIRSLGRKGVNVEPGINATGERTFRIVK